MSRNGRRRSQHSAGSKHVRISSNRRLRKSRTHSGRLTPGKLRSLPARQQDARTRSLNALREMRARKLTLYQAAREIGVDPRTLRRWAKPALRKLPNGRYTAKRSDQLVRILTIPGKTGTTEVAVRGSRKASELAKYAAAVQKSVNTGDDADLLEFRDKTILDASGKPIPLPTDLDELELLGKAGVLSFESLYSRSAQ